MITTEEHEVKFMERYKQFERYINGMSKYSEVNGFDRDDIKQELLMILDKCVKTFDSTKASFSTYFINSCKNRIARLRKQRRYDYYYLNNELIEDVIDNQDDILKSEVFVLLGEVEHGDVAIMNLFYGVTKIELAESNNVSQTTIANWIRKAIADVKGALFLT